MLIHIGAVCISDFLYFVYLDSYSDRNFIYSVITELFFTTFTYTFLLTTINPNANQY